MQRKPVRRSLYRRCLVVLAVVLSLPGSWGCMKKIPYRDEQIAAFKKRQENIRLQFTTDKGMQVAFYVPPEEAPHLPPQQVAVLYPGINSLALDFLEYIRLDDDPGTGYLLIDYPGRGHCDGIMRPEENYRNTEGALKALAKHFGRDSVGADLVLLGHSFGTGAALQFALRQNVKRVVLAAPFTTLTEAVSLQSRLLAILMPAEIDNVAQIRELLTAQEPPVITIYHGVNDITLPVYMGKKLATADPDRIDFFEIPGGSHMSILKSHRDLLFQALLGRRVLLPD